MTDTDITADRDNRVTVPTRGRPVRLVPTAPGFWTTVLGVALAALAPLFGFLIGSMVAAPEEDVWLEPIYWGLFIGIVIGGVALVVAVFGGWRLWKHSRQGRDEIGVAEETEE